MEIIRLDPGDTVLCDLCNADYTESEEKGGMLFGGKAVCPQCLPEFMKGVRKFEEEEFIADSAREDETFRDFVYRIRHGEDQIVKTPAKDVINKIIEFAKKDKLSLVQCKWTESGEEVWVLCYVHEHEHEANPYELVPFATLLEGNPYSLLTPPEEISNGNTL